MLLDFETNRALVNYLWEIFIFELEKINLPYGDGDGRISGFKGVYQRKKIKRRKNKLEYCC